jgi:hypothetical protein
MFPPGLCHLFGHNCFVIDASFSGHESAAAHTALIRRRRQTALRPADGKEDMVASRRTIGR